MRIELQKKYDVFERDTITGPIISAEGPARAFVYFLPGDETERPVGQIWLDDSEQNVVFQCRSCKAKTVLREGPFRCSCWHS